MKAYLERVRRFRLRFGRAWRGEIHLSPPYKLFLLGCRFSIVPQAKIGKNKILVACHPSRQHEVLKAFQDAAAKFDPRIGKAWKSG